jgi:hypothetical protein
MAYTEYIKDTHNLDIHLMELFYEFPYWEAKYRDVDLVIEYSNKNGYIFSFRLDVGYVKDDYWKLIKVVDKISEFPKKYLSSTYQIKNSNYGFYSEKERSYIYLAKDKLINVRYDGEKCEWCHKSYCPNRTTKKMFIHSNFEIKFNKCLTKFVGDLMRYYDGNVIYSLILKALFDYNLPKEVIEVIIKFCGMHIKFGR